MKNSLRVEAETNTVVDYPHTISCAKDLTHARTIIERIISGFLMFSRYICPS
jgi:hypothetical protein